MREVKQVEIGGVEYSLGQIPAMKSWKLMTRLLKIVGGPLANAANGKSDDLLDMDVGQIIGPLVENLDSPDAESIVKELLKYAWVNVDGQSKQVDTIADTHFAGRIGDMVELIIEQVKFQYSDVFQKLGSKLGGSLPSQSMMLQSTSAGPSGGLSPQKSRRSKK